MARAVGIFTRGRTESCNPVEFSAFFLILLTLPSHAPGIAPKQMHNAAASENGGIAMAAFSQDTFDPVFAVDGDATTPLRGWAYHGKIHLAHIVFGFDKIFNISRARIVSGVGMEDHHITEFEIWYLDIPSAATSTAHEAALVFREQMQRSELDIDALKKVFSDR